MIITAFADELILQIFSHVPPLDLIEIMPTCKQFNRIIKDKSLWQGTEYGNLDEECQRMIRLKLDENIYHRYIFEHDSEDLLVNYQKDICYQVPLKLSIFLNIGPKIKLNQIQIYHLILLYSETFELYDKNKTKVVYFNDQLRVLFREYEEGSIHCYTFISEIYNLLNVHQT